MDCTEAWVLRRGDADCHRAQLEQCTLQLPPPDDDQLLVETLFGCWEGNMGHAVERRPIDVCIQRNEPSVVIGNAGVVRVLRGNDAAGLFEGETCMLVGIGEADDAGFVRRAFAYDAPGTVGLLAKRTLVRPSQLIKLRPDSRLSLPQWAAFSARYVTAWANSKIASRCWRAFDLEARSPTVWAWGGGVSFAQLCLAKRQGVQAVTMITSMHERATMLREAGVDVVDRSVFRNLAFDENSYETDAGYRERYLHDERRFLTLVKEKTEGAGVSIFFDHIGAPVFRATVKALGRPGVVATAGWKCGMQLRSVRAVECMQWHVHVHTHYGRRTDAEEAVAFAEDEGWAPSLRGQCYRWSDIPRLAAEYAAGEIESYFPIFAVNAV